MSFEDIARKSLGIAPEPEDDEDPKPATTVAIERLEEGYVMSFANVRGVRRYAVKSFDEVLLG